MSFLPESHYKNITKYKLINIEFFLCYTALTDNQKFIFVNLIIQLDQDWLSGICILLYLKSRETCETSRRK